MKLLSSYGLKWPSQEDKHSAYTSLGVCSTLPLLHIANENLLAHPRW